MYVTFLMHTLAHLRVLEQALVFLGLCLALLVMPVALHTVLEPWFLLTLPQAQSRPGWSPERREGGGVQRLGPNLCFRLSTMGGRGACPGQTVGGGRGQCHNTC